MNPKMNDPIAFRRSRPAESQVPTAEPANQVFDFYSLGMAQAMQLTKLAFEASVCVNSCMMDMYRHLFWNPFGLQHWFQGGKEGYAKWMDFGAQWAKTMLPSDERRHFTRSEPEPTPEEVAENIEAMEDGFDVAAKAFDNEILA